MAGGAGAEGSEVAPGPACPPCSGAPGRRWGTCPPCSGVLADGKGGESLPREKALFAGEHEDAGVLSWQCLCFSGAAVCPSDPVLLGQGGRGVLPARARDAVGRPPPTSLGLMAPRSTLPSCVSCGRGVALLCALYSGIQADGAAPIWALPFSFKGEDWEAG